MAETENPKLTPEMLVPRLGEYLVQKGHITEEDLQEALQIQQAKIATGESPLLGQTLVDLNVISRDILDQAVTEQIIQLRNALQATNRNLERSVQERTAELQSALERLSDLSKLKANFISNISHELRTPLNGIIGIAESLSDGVAGQPSDKMKSNFDILISSGKRLANLVNDILDFSKLRSH